MNGSLENRFLLERLRNDCQVVWPFYEGPILEENNMRGGLTSTRAEASLEDYMRVGAKAVVTVIDAGEHDWFWYFVGENLIYEGHNELDKEVLTPLLDAMLGSNNWILQSEWIVDWGLVDNMRSYLERPSDILEQFGYEPEEILIYL